MRLTRQQTMKRASEFAMVKTVGTSEAGRFLVLSTAALPVGQEDVASRFGIITTKKVGHAVVRNLMRRRVREILRARGEALASGLRVVIIVRNRAATAAYADMEKDFLKLLQRFIYKRTRSAC